MGVVDVSLCLEIRAPRGNLLLLRLILRLDV
jgi:hypothetical protein